MNRYLTILLSLFILFASIVFYGQLEACSRLTPVNVRQTALMARYIIRATAIEYSQPPANSQGRTTGVPDSKVSFRVEEILKGDKFESPLELNGYLSDSDDYNDQPVPYKFVRRNGRAGSCFANTYKQGAQFLLFLKPSDQVTWPVVTTRFTVNIDPLAPVNEQLHSSDDPWIHYVKSLIEGSRDSTRFERKRN